MTVCEMTQGHEGVTTLLISELNDGAWVCDVSVPSISNGTGLDQSQKGFIESGPDTILDHYGREYRGTEAVLSTRMRSEDLRNKEIICQLRKSSSDLAAAGL